MPELGPAVEHEARSRLGPAEARHRETTRPGARGQQQPGVADPAAVGQRHLVRGQEFGRRPAGRLDVHPGISPRDVQGRLGRHGWSPPMATQQ
jgi:hypothetical protein